uniref:VOC domain-containing protein n=1 Tax=Oryza punctata TaxID=4537 RepID=A0A0E0LHE1_ORYPU
MATRCLYSLALLSPSPSPSPSSSGKVAARASPPVPSAADPRRRPGTRLSVATGGEQLVTAQEASQEPDYGVVSIHHVGILCENLERSMAFYKDLLGAMSLKLTVDQSGLKVNPARPTDKLPYRGAWLWVGSEMIHLMELPNPDPLTGRPEHGGRDRHTCIAIKDVLKLKEIFDKAGH